MAKRRKITSEMIRKYFGPDAGIEEQFFGDGFRVTTTNGGEIEIGQTEFRIRAGGDDVYEAMTLLSAEAWGGLTARGSQENIMAFMAHGEALGVPVTPEVKVAGGCLRIFVAPFVFMMVAGTVECRGRSSHRVYCWRACDRLGLALDEEIRRPREARRQAQALRYPFPRIHGSARYSSDEDLRKGGLI